MGQKNERNGKEDAQSPSASLVPLYSGLDVAHGVQAYRRGNAILYTIRGEPKDVEQLMHELDKHNVREVVALISHPASQENHPQESED